MNNLCGKWIFTIAAVMFFLCVPRSFAGTEDDGWKFTIGPNFWMAGVEGDAVIKGREIDIDVGFDDIIDNTEGALMLRMEAQKGVFGLFLQPNYLKISIEDDVEHVDAAINVDFWLVEFGGFYQLAQLGEQMPTTIDLLFGARYWALSTEIDLHVPVLGVDQHREVDRNLIDPLVGLRLVTNMTDSLKLSLWGDIGGFDINEDTPKFSWQAGGDIGYQVSKRVTVFAGYRAVGIDAEKDNKELDLTFHGPLLGFNTQW